MDLIEYIADKEAMEKAVTEYYEDKRRVIVTKLGYSLDGKGILLYYKDDTGRPCVQMVTFSSAKIILKIKRGEYI